MDKGTSAIVLPMVWAQWNDGDGGGGVAPDLAGWMSLRVFSVGSGKP
jgi:hypothetical protein